MRLRLRLPDRHFKAAIGCPDFALHEIPNIADRQRESYLHSPSLIVIQAAIDRIERLDEQAFLSGVIAALGLSQQLARYIPEVREPCIQGVDRYHTCAALQFLLVSIGR